MKKYLLLISLLIGILSLSNAQKKKGRTPEKDIDVPKGLTYQIKQYNTFKGTPLRANQIGIAYKDDNQKNKPVVIFIHGGGWANGDKNNTLYQAFNVAKQGFVGITISYRLISEANFPACIEDVKEAVRYVKSLEGELPIDVNRIGVWGYSAGAHLALMVGLSDEKLFKTDQYKNYNCNVKAIMAVAAPTDFIGRKKNRGNINILSKEQNNDTDFLEKISPLYFVHQGQPDIYMLHGTKDPIVQPFHYQNFEQKCNELAIKNFTLFEIKEGGHMFYFKRNDEVRPIFKDFLQKVKSTTIH